MFPLNYITSLLVSDPKHCNSFLTPPPASGFSPSRSLQVSTARPMFPKGSHSYSQASDYHLPCLLITAPLLLAPEAITWPQPQGGCSCSSPSPLWSRKLSFPRTSTIQETTLCLFNEFTASNNLLLLLCFHQTGLLQSDLKHSKCKSRPHTQFLSKF